jgi:lysophospholipase L1-like esterase
MLSHTDSKAFHPNRRQFVLAGAGVSAAGLAALASVDALLAQSPAEASQSAEPLLKPGQTILFQGDSITDAGRNRDNAEANAHGAMGDGYAWMAASQLLVDTPDAGYKIFNRGISGNKVPQLAERWQADCLDLKPDVLSILIGVNDFWHMKNGEYKGTVKTYEDDYRELLKRTRDALPDVRLVICEPFLLVSGNITADWVPEFAAYRAAAQRVAEGAGATWVPFQTMFDVASKIAEPKVWAADGVHPSANGAALMAHWWLKGVGAHG